MFHILNYYPDYRSLLYTAITNGYGNISNKAKWRGCKRKSTYKRKKAYGR